MLKNIILLILLIAASRFIGLPANFSPLLALAVFMPRLTDDLRIQYLLPVTILAVTNLFLEPVNIIILTTMLLVFAITPAVSRISNNLFWGAFSAVLIWHFVVNGAVWIASGGSIIHTYIAAIPLIYSITTDPKSNHLEIIVLVLESVAGMFPCCSIDKLPCPEFTTRTW